MVLCFLLFPFIISCVLEVGIGKFRTWNQSCCSSSTLLGEQGSCLDAFGHLGLLWCFRSSFQQLWSFCYFCNYFWWFFIFLLFSSFFLVIQLGCHVVSFSLWFYVCKNLKQWSLKLKAQSFINFFSDEQGACLHTLTHVLSVVFPNFLNDSWSSCCLAPLRCFLCVGI
jgi:hypothetical protein